MPLPMLLLAPPPQSSPPARTPVSPTAPSGYARFVTLSDGTLEMDTAAARLVASGRPDVWLVGAIHIGAKPYYATLQRLLDAQGEVLYEGVKATPDAPSLARRPTPKPGDPTPTYKLLSDALGLDFQLADIDYRRPNWTNVDLTWAELDALNRAQANGKPSQYDQVKGMLDPAGGAAKALSSMLGVATPGMKEAIKILMIRAAGAENTPGLDPATERILVRARNKTVVDALAAATNAPTPPKSIAVFYGAKHMPDLQATLVERYGYRLDEKRWFPAATADPGKVDATGKTMLDAFEKALAPKPAPPAKAP